jgi:hypothetical protein
MTSYLAGDILTADALNLRPYYHGYQSVAQSLVNGTPTAVTMTSEIADSINGHNVSLNTSRYLPTVAGLYYCTGVAAYAVTAVGKYVVQVWKNGGNDNGAKYSAYQAENTSIANTGQCVATVRCNGTTDYIELYTYHYFGATVATLVSGVAGCSLICEWVAP